MEYRIIDDDAAEGQQLPMSGEAVQHLVKSRNWAMFIAIVGFVGIGLIFLAGMAFLVLGIFGQSKPSGLMGMSAGLMALAYLLMVIVYFFPVFYLWKFSRTAFQAVAKLDPAQLTLAMKNLKKYFIWAGSIMIGVIALYLLIIIGVFIQKTFL